MTKRKRGKCIYSLGEIKFILFLSLKEMSEGLLWSGRRDSGLTAALC